jgi:hypothetical protein
MRFLMLQLGDRSADGRPTGPSGEAIRAYEDDLRTAGVVLASETLHPSRTATSVLFGDGDPVVLDGPSDTTGLVVRGFRILDVRSAADAVAWARRNPLILSSGATERAVIEIHEIDDGPPW